ncbi:hypothetical protein D7Y21_02370 [Corallococcus sp. AB045]|nr:SIR2 family protein [Corallococcus sp. AB045]RKH91439.1 hypothetical protein D7Y21_02370 [Corallococcus sp. AB045]
MSVHKRGAHWAPILVPALHDLKQAYDEGNLIAFVGAGVSAAAGLPTWPQLAQELLKYGHAQQLNEAATSEIGSLINHYELIEAFTELKSALGATSFCNVIEKHLNDRDSQVPEVANSIARLAPKLRAIITTNLDHLLERAFAGSWQATPNPPADIAQRRNFILKAHGTLLDRSTWVFTRDEYDRAVHNNHNLKTPSDQSSMHSPYFLLATAFQMEILMLPYQKYEHFPAINHRDISQYYLKAIFPQAKQGALSSPA